MKIWLLKRLNRCIYNYGFYDKRTRHVAKLLGILELYDEDGESD